MPADLKQGLHPRNRFRNRYDFEQLVACCPALAAFVVTNAHGDESVDYANPAAVKALNQALLKWGYGIETWDIPAGYLCPPVPGRSDYLHYVADLLGCARGKSVSVLDIGTGANGIYPLIGACEYGWRFVGAEVDAFALKWARKLVTANRNVRGLIDCRLQTSAMECFQGVMKPDEVFDASMCNPPFHGSAAEAAAGTRRKLHNLGGQKGAAPVLNFGGKDGELWCEGGELAFVRRMIHQSAELPQRCFWFTSLISKSDHLRPLNKTLKSVGVAEVRTIEMTQGQKKSRILAWTFLSPAEHDAWRLRRS